LLVVVGRLGCVDAAAAKMLAGSHTAVECARVGASCHGSGASAGCRDARSRRAIRRHGVLWQHDLHATVAADDGTVEVTHTEGVTHV
jgi:hypothetical protein